MKSVFVVVFSCIFSFLAISQQNVPDLSIPDVTKKIVQAKAACGICQFGQAGKSCELAVRIKNKTYYVDGATIDSFGDAHAADGFCNAIRKAEVQGDVVDNRYQLTYFKFLSSKKKKQ